MTLHQLQQALQSLRATLSVSANGAMGYTAVLSRHADRTQVVTTGETLELAVERVVARMVELRRRHPTAPSLVSYETSNTNPWAVPPERQNP